MKVNKIRITHKLSILFFLAIMISGIIYLAIRVTNDNYEAELSTSKKLSNLNESTKLDHNEIDGEENEEDMHWIDLNNFRYYLEITYTNTAMITKVVKIDDNSKEKPLDKIVLPTKYHYKSYTYPISIIATEGGWPSEIKHLVIPEGYEQIYDNAFEECIELVEVELPNSLAHIGSYAFAGCSHLKKINIPADLKELCEGVFSNTGLEELIVPEGVLKIHQDVIYGSTELKRISLPSTLYYMSNRSLRIGEYADIKADSITMSKENPCYKIKEGALYDIYEKKLYYVIVTDSGNYELPESVETIYSESFQDTCNLQKVKLNESITVLPQGIFRDSNINEIELSASLEVIESYAFSNSKLTNIQLPEGLKYIDDYAFQNVSLDDIILPTTIQYLGYYSFNQSLKSINITFRGEKVPHIYALGKEALNDGTYFTFYVPNEQYIEYEAMLERNQHYGSYRIKAMDSLESFIEEKGEEEINTGIHQVTGSGQKDVYSIVIEDENHIYTLMSNEEKTRYIITDISWRERNKVDEGKNGTTLSIPSLIIQDGKEFMIFEIHKDISYPEGITKLVIEEGIEVIQSYAFTKAKIEHIVIPSSMKYIRDFAFELEGGVRLVSFMGKEPPYFEVQSVHPENEGTSFKFIVPDGCERTYKDALAINNPSDIVRYTIN